MTRKLGWLVVMLAWTAMASASGHSGQVSGFVRNAQGVAQMGAAVEVTKLGGNETLRAFTDTRGFFALAGLMPGKYDVKVSAPSFLPSLTQNLAVISGAKLMMNITLNTLFEAVTLLPERKKPTDDEDDWKWTLRSQSNRPILRVVNGAPVVVSERKREEDDNRATVAFIAGAQAGGFGSNGGYGTAFDLQRSVVSIGTFGFTGNVAYSSSGDPGGVVRLAYRREMPNGSRPEISLVARRITSPDLGIPTQTLQSFTGTASNTTLLTSSIEVNYGAAFQTIQFAGREEALRPFATMDWHLSPDTVVEYRYATSVPNARNLKGYDDSNELGDNAPRVTMLNGRGALEDAAHHEVSVSRHIGKNNVQFAMFVDRIRNAELTGVGTVDDAAGEVLPDVNGGTFSYNGGEFSSNGMRIVVERKLHSDVTATLDYAFGGVLDLNGRNVNWGDVRGLLQEHRSHALTGKVAGTLPGAKTHWIASYRWMNGAALTPVDIFNVSPGEGDAYLNIFVRQPLPRTRLIPGKMEAVVDLRNLLAQGYIPVVTNDGGTVYLVQSARSVRGGVAFTF